MPATRSRLELYVKLFQLAAVLMIAAGLLIIAGIGRYIPAPASYVVDGVGGLLLILGILFYRRIDDIRYRLFRRRGGVKKYAVLVAVLLLANFIAPAVYQYGGNDCTAECWTVRNNVITAENAILGILVTTFLLTILPMILGRTALNPLVNEISGLAGSALIVLIAAMLIIYPIHVMFVPCGGGGYGGYGGGGGTCYIDPCQLVQNGPPLLRVFLRWLLAPLNAC